LEAQLFQGFDAFVSGLILYGSPVISRSVVNNFELLIVPTFLDYLLYLLYGMVRKLFGIVYSDLQKVVV